MLPYLAILGTGWIPLLRGRLRTAAVAAVCGIALIYAVGAVADSGPQLRIDLVGATDSNHRHVALYSPGGWIAGKPDSSGAVFSVMKSARDAGMAIQFDPGAQQPRFNHPGLDIMSRMASVPFASPFDPNNPRMATITYRNPPPPEPRPCAVSSDGSGIYLYRGPVEVPFEQREFFCP
jgi:hypothetical protein